MRIGIFGGTFDPPHIGHLILAQEACLQLTLTQVLWVITPYPPHKKTQVISPIHDRISMVLLAISGNSLYSISRVDIDRQPPHYAVDTMAILRDRYPKDELYYLMGADSLNDLPSWHDPDLFIERCHGIGIMVRQDDDINTEQLEEIFPGLSEKIHLLEAPFIEISGSEIRNRVKRGKEFRYFLPEKIYRYILNHKLYQS